MGYDRRDMISTTILNSFAAALHTFAIVLLEAAENGFASAHLYGLAGASCHLAVSLGMFGPCLP